MRSLPTPRYAVQSHKLVGLMARFIFLFLLSSVYPVSIKFFKPFFIIMCPRNINCLFLILPRTTVIFTILLQTSLLLTPSIQGISLESNLFPPIFFSSLRKFSIICCYVKGPILYSSSVFFSKETFLLILNDSFFDGLSTL